MDGSISSSTSTFHPLDAVSPPSSALPSPPDSPSSGSVSSFPSVSSSFFFSSTAASPPQPQPHLDHLTEGLIIPSLTLPSALRRPTAYGQTIGDLRILVLGNKGTGKTYLANLLLEDNDAVVDFGCWEETEHGKVLYASTDWIEHKDAHGLEKYEPTRNVEIIELSSYNGAQLVNQIRSIIHSPFHALAEALHPDHPPSSLVASLLSSSSTPLFTVLIFLLPSTPTVLDCLLIKELGNEIPLIVLPRLHSPPQEPSLLHKLSSFRPSTAVALRSGLFNCPDTLSLLRSEATDRFFKWREVERMITHIRPRPSLSQFSHLRTLKTSMRWDKEKWESEYLTSFSQDVAGRARGVVMRQPVLTLLNQRRNSFINEEGEDEKDLDSDDDDEKEYLLPPQDSSSSSSSSYTPLDPLHLPSLMFFSISLLKPLRIRLHRSISGFFESIASEKNVRVALLGGFCVGLGIGVVMARWKMIS
ncbi:hypothetical protein AGABI1DRAFT_107519 [Agaricus bisporus var. burnettii JB137-S8]|uniref:Septin-type G domain-containing protein n=1 Tax=Agaricus bisporus var. burnettii (strain JB137-S8 / ATCC MYA-4627 / FGSC 10392) TaxID=597362 RepID=K5VUY9_AGABU|nr:uncharacterized protein AGABI1DRAFT_107519 [Agaricus bisporus var. burnettii JB137-S8]EKM78299.1 hypothetical protein AGABI1DRAFT_107519 [Agaricus bisporus var. burnettii JB137-S8]